MNDSPGAANLGRKHFRGFGAFPVGCMQVSKVDLRQHVPRACSFDIFIWLRVDWNEPAA